MAGLSRKRLAGWRRYAIPLPPLSTATFDRPRAPPSACGGGDISPMNPPSQASRTASAPDSFFTATLEQADPEIVAAIKGELGRQRHEIELIASENIVSRAVLEAQGSVMT